MGKPKKIIDRDDLERLYIHEKQSPKRIASMFGCNRQTIINRLREYGLPVRSISEGTAFAKIRYPRAHFNGNEAEKAYLIGLRVGDLTVDMVNRGGQSIRVSCASTRMEQIVLIRDLFEPYGRVLLNGPYANNRIFIQCLLDLSFDFLLDKPGQIPGWIQEKGETFWAFLGGYSDAEAHIGISNGKASFRLGTADARILEQIHEHLTETGIKCPKPYIWLYKGYTSKSGASSNKDIWRLGIYRKHDLQLFLSLLLPNLHHQKRAADAGKALAWLDLAN